MVRSFILLLIAGIFSFKSQAQGMMLSGVIDGPIPGGLPKAVEVYVYEDIADLSLYGIGSANNGGGSDGQEFTFPAVSATAGTYIYIASEAVEFTNFMGFAPDYTSSATNINGDDAFELFFNGSVIDVFGDINVDGTGQSWEYLDGWVYRNQDTGPDGTTFVLSNWTYSGPNALDGETSNATAATSFPSGSFTSILPVELTSFEANSNGSKLVLTWQTAVEVNNRGFYIEKSVDGISFESIGFVVGNGNSNSMKSYQFNDTNFYQTSYYRLKQVDFDGAYENSFVIRAENTTRFYSIYPNPVDDVVNINVPVEKFDVLIIDASGKVYFQGKLSRSTASTKISSLKQGVYSVRLSSSHFLMETRVIKK